MSQYFPKPYERFGGDISVRVDLSNHAIKADIKKISHVDTSSFAQKTNFASLKTGADELDIDKLVPVLVDLSKLSDAVKNDVVKKAEYNELVAKVNNIKTSGFVLKTEYDTDKPELENKTPDTTGLVKKTDYNTRIAEIEGKIPDVINLATKTVLNTVENKIPSVSSLAQKLDTKITEIEKKLTDHNQDKYITIPEFNTLAADGFNARLVRANLVTKTDFDAKMPSLNKRVTANKIKDLLVENELKQLKTIELSYFIGKSHFEEDGTQHYLVFQPLNKYLKIITNTKYISLSQSKGLLDETIKPPTRTDYKRNLKLSCFGTKTKLDFRRSCLEQDKITFNHEKIVNIYTVYELDKIHVKTTPYVSKLFIWSS